AEVVSTPRPSEGEVAERAGGVEAVEAEREREHAVVHPVARAKIGDQRRAISRGRAVAKTRHRRREPDESVPREERLETRQVAGVEGAFEPVERPADRANVADDASLRAERIVLDREVDVGRAAQTRTDAADPPARDRGHGGIAADPD